MPHVIVSRLRVERHRASLRVIRVPPLSDVPKNSSTSHMAEAGPPPPVSDSRASPARVEPRWPIGVPADRAALSVAETCRLLGISRAWLYTLIRWGELASVSIGRRRLILVESIVKLLDGTERAPSAPSAAVERPPDEDGDRRRVARYVTAAERASAGNRRRGTKARPIRAIRNDG